MCGQLMTLYLYDRQKFINIYGACCLARCCWLTSGASSFGYFKIPSRRCFIFDTQVPNASAPVRSPQSCHRTLLPLSRTHVLYFLRAYHITHKQAKHPFYVFRRDFLAAGFQVNRITYTNYHHHCALKNIFLLISLWATKVMHIP